MIKGKIYNFFPVQTQKDDETFESCDTWHWTFFGWWFEMYTFLRATTASLMGIENLPFAIKIKEEDYEND